MQTSYSFYNNLLLHFANKFCYISAGVPSTNFKADASQNLSLTDLAVRTYHSTLIYTCLTGFKLLH